MKWWQVAKVSLVAIVGAVAFGCAAYASPFGQGVFGADVPFGSDTSMSIALSGNVDLAVDAPSGGTLNGSGAHMITVTSTDVVGYRLYIFAPVSTNMTNGSDTITASGNSSPSTLATDTWGYNTTGSTTDFMGITSTPVAIKDATGPHKNGDATTVTFGAKVSQTKGAGSYASTVVYTAVGKSQ